MPLLLPLAILAALGDWLAVASRRRRLEGIFKPLTMILLIAWFALRAPPGSHPAAAALLVGLLLSLVGDVALFLRPRAGFMAGLLAFLAAHIAYSLAFALLGMDWGAALAAFLAALAIWSPVLRRILAALRAAGRAKLQAPIVVYTALLAWMLASAVGFAAQAGWRGSAPLAAMGGTAFLLSDSLLAWNRFVGRLPGGRTIEHALYHLAQFALALSVTLAL